ncbi:MAG: glycosyltransferase [Pseudomonadota bacterium]
MKWHLLPQKLFNCWRFIPMYLALRQARRNSTQAPVWRDAEDWGRGISVLIPESGTPDLLLSTLAHAREALAQIDEPGEIVVMVNGAEQALYAELQKQFDKVVWLFAREALGFNGAVETGLRAVQYPAVYLLNSDMRIAPDAIAQLLPYRTPSVFSLGSQIFFADAERRREETGWTDYYVLGGRTVIYDRDPDNTMVARGNMYSGGGSSLFKTTLLKEYMHDSWAYSPFYWEDAEWGTRAWVEGLESIFVPASKAVHEHRGTIKRRFAPEEVARIIDRNALLFEMRHHFTDLDGIRAWGHLSGQPAQTQKELRSPRIAQDVAVMRASNDAVKNAGFFFNSIINRYYFASHRAELPTVLWVTPFAIYPPAHGGARRIGELAKRLAPYVNLILLSDESDAYKNCNPENFSPFESAHLLQARKDTAGQKLHDLGTRMKDHAPKGLRYELRRIQQQHKVDLVQIEFMEASHLVEARLGNVPFVAALHDVYLDGGSDDQFQIEVLERYDAVVTCSGEDAAFLTSLPHHVIANGAEDRFAESRESSDKKSILFMGPFRYVPNYAGILQFLEFVWPTVLATHPDAELIILGGTEAARAEFANPLLKQSGVRLVAEFVDPAPYLAACSLTINPQQEIRGSALKVAESLLAKRVCVTTRNGARGFTDLQTEALRIADDWSEMSREIARLLSDQDFRHRIESSNEAVRKKLSWDASAEALLLVYQNLIPQKFRNNPANES